MSRWCLPVLGLLALLVLNACGDDTPTGIGDDLFPIEPQTLEISLTWEEFASSLQLWSGYGRITDLPELIVAHDFQGVLDARVLSRFQRYPGTVQVRDPGGGTRTDTAYSFVGGRLVARFDTTGLEEGFDIQVLRPPAGWDPLTASWTAAVDSIDILVPWEEPGAGPATLLATGGWARGEGDSLVVELDSATVAALGDTLQFEPGIRIDMETEGSRIFLEGLDLEVDVVPSTQTDTIVSFPVGSRALTFIYDPVLEPPEDGLRVGGAPSWRSTLRFSLPATVDGPPELCARVGCPFELDADRLNAATLVLTSRPAPAGFWPRDSLRIDARPVLVPPLLPKAPLGASLLMGQGVAVAPELFGDGGGIGEAVNIPITGFVRDLLQGETAAGEVPPDVLALLAPFEPRSFGVASFVGPGGAGEPVLRMILTSSDTVQIR